MTMANATVVAPSGNHIPNVRSNSEKRLGILHYTSCIDFGWHGDIRRRYVLFCNVPFSLCVPL